MAHTIDNLRPVCWMPSPPRSTPSVFSSVRGWFARRRSVPAHDDALLELDAHTLADIGAPAHVLDRALARREQQRQERDALRLGLAAGAWRHW